jgi:hypothetical protein
MANRDYGWRGRGADPERLGREGYREGYRGSREGYFGGGTTGEENLDRGGYGEEFRSGGREGWGFREGGRGGRWEGGYGGAYGAGEYRGGEYRGGEYRGGMAGREADWDAFYGGYGREGGFGDRDQYGRSFGAYGGTYGRPYGGRSQRESFAGRGPKGWRRSDEQIRDEVNERLARDADVDATDVEVRVEGGVVILSGVVEDRGQKRRAEDLVEEVFGVDDVRNELKVRHGFLARLTGEQAGEREVTRASERETAAAVPGASTGATTGTRTGGAKAGSRTSAT